jgi:hypothetical protein
MSGHAWVSIVLSLSAIGMSLGSVYFAHRTKQRYEQAIADLNKRRTP